MYHCKNQFLQPHALSALCLSNAHFLLPSAPCPSEIMDPQNQMHLPAPKRPASAPVIPPNPCPTLACFTALRPCTLPIPCPLSCTPAMHPPGLLLCTPAMHPPWPTFLCSLVPPASPCQYIQHPAPCTLNVLLSQPPCPSSLPHLWVLCPHCFGHPRPNFLHSILAQCTPLGPCITAMPNEPIFAICLFSAPTSGSWWSWWSSSFSSDFL